MRQTGRRSAAILAVLALTVFVALPGVARAKKFQMTGNWFDRNGQVFIPLGINRPHSTKATPMGNPVWTSMGNGFVPPDYPPFSFHFPAVLAVVHLPGSTSFPVLATTAIGAWVAPFISQTTPVLSMGFGIPNGPIPGLGGVTATSGMTMGQALQIPRGRFKKNTSQVVPLNGANLLQISTNFTFNNPAAVANLASMGGPGAQTWCPSNPACTAAGTVPGAAGTNGRVIYAAGARTFGGAMQIGLVGFGDNAIPIGGGQVAHLLFGTTALTMERVLAPGKQMGSLPTTEMVYLPAAFVTTPVTSAGLILTTGPKVTTGMGHTDTGTGAIFNTLSGQFTTNYGFSHTTGQVRVQQITGTGGHDFFTVTGSDMRTSLGAGNISLVAGGLSRRNNAGGPGVDTTYAAYHKVFMTLGEAVPSMSPAGFAAAGALMLLAVGYSLRRRLQ